MSIQQHFGGTLGTAVQVTVIAKNEAGEDEMKVVECRNWTTALRFAHTYVPKKGYRTVYILMEEMDVLV